MLVLHYGFWRDAKATQVPVEAVVYLVCRHPVKYVTVALQRPAYIVPVSEYLYSVWVVCFKSARHPNVIGSMIFEPEIDIRPSLALVPVAPSCVLVERARSVTTQTKVFH